VCVRVLRDEPRRCSDQEGRKAVCALCRARAYVPVRYGVTAGDVREPPEGGQEYEAAAAYAYARHAAYACHVAVTSRRARVRGNGAPRPPRVT